jgi:uncharacterized membrane protein (DUF2068 family)
MNWGSKEMTEASPPYLPSNPASLKLLTKTRLLLLCRERVFCYYFCCGQFCRDRVSKYVSRKHRKEHHQGGLRTVACFEAAKGILVLVTGFGLLAFIHRDLHHAAEQLVRHLHFNPASHYPAIFIDTMTQVTDSQLWALSASALGYSTVRAVEAYGLWHERPWAEWFGLLSGGIYLPMELYELFRGVTWAKMVIFIVNLWIVAYLSSVLVRSGHRQKNRHH